MELVKNPYRRRPQLTFEEYQRLYQHSITNPAEFWAQQAEHYLDLHTPFNQVLSGEINQALWFEGAKLNVSYHCLDRHLEKRAQQVAYYWESDSGQTKQLSYQQLYDDVCRMSNVLKKYGVKKGDTVCIYLPMILEAPVAMLACARIGAIHSVVFAGFSPNALKMRIDALNCQFVITADQSCRGGKRTPLKNNVDEAIKDSDTVRHVLVVKQHRADKTLSNTCDLDWHEEKQQVKPFCEAEVMNANDPLFILYTSGSTGKAKGVVHTHCGYLLYAQMTHRLIFDYQDNDIYWCAADIGWITGHSYIVYGPLANGASSVLFEGIPTYPDASRNWKIVDKYQVNIFYTAPTALRALLREGEQWLATSKRDSLYVLGTVGEPINPAAWHWYFDKVGMGQCAVVDTWWQTETGGIMISAFPGLADLKPGYAQTPFFGVVPKLIDAQGNISDLSGFLALQQPWPGMAHTLYNDAPRYQTYFEQGRLLTGDGAHKDGDNHFQITGRTDDVLNVSGHRLGSAEIESAIISHPACSEAAVVGASHKIKGESITAFVTLKAGFKGDEQLKQAITQTIRQQIGPIASPEKITWAPGLPKTRSGKIMRRLLRKIADNNTDDLGDISTLAEPDIIPRLIKAFHN